MRDKSISHAYPRARAAAEQFERRYVQLAIACLPAGACCGGPSEKNVPGWPSRGLSGSRSGCLGTLIYLLLRVGPSCALAPPARRLLPRTGRFRVRVLLRAGRSRVPGAPARRLLPHQPLSYQLLPHQPPEQGACKMGSCRVEIGPATAQVAHSLRRACNRGAPRDIRRFGRARVGEPVCAGLDHAGSNPSPVAALRRPTPARGHDVAV